MTTELDFAALVRHAYDGVNVVDMDGRFLAVNDEYCRMSGYAEEELLAMHLWDVDGVFDRASVLANLASMVPDERVRFETVHRHKDGSLYEVEASVKLLPGAERRAMASIRDLRDPLPLAARPAPTREFAASLASISAALLESEARLRSMADTIEDVFWIGDPSTGEVLYVSAGVERVWGVAAESFIDGTVAWLDQVVPDDIPLAQRAWEACVTGEAAVVEYRLQRPDGGVRWIRNRGYPRLDAAGNVSVIFGAATDITEQRKAEEQLRTLSRAVDQSASIIVVTDAQAQIEYVNARFTAVTGYTAAEVRGRNARLLQSGKTPRATYDQMWDTLGKGREWRGDFHNRRKNGEDLIEQVTISPIFDDHGRITHYLAVKEDVTEGREIQARALQSQKMEALGHLAGGVAHDFNNLLLVISGYCECLVDDGIGAPFLEMVNEILAAANRAGDLTQRLLAFSRHRAGAPRPVELDAAVRGTLQMLRRILRESIRLEHVDSPAPLTVMADRALLDQVLLNLTVNARDAMPDGGRLQIEVTRAHARDRHCAVLRVADSGHGIAPAELPHIFEPFFTTKRSGKGTGLGLATVYGIVEQHGGWIDVESVLGEGAEFRIYLPLCDKAAEAEPVAPVSVSVGGNERVLLVEDEDAVRELLCGLLVRLGYRVMTAASGEQGLECWLEHRGEFDIVVTDVVMPGISGHELGRRLQAACPELPVLYLSGYSPEAQSTPRAANFLSKPCSQAQLDQKIRSILAAAATRLAGSGEGL